MLDFSNEQEQQEGVGGFVKIPNNSICKVRFSLDDAGDYAAGHPSVSKASTGLLQLVYKFDFVNTQSNTMRFNRITLKKDMQNIQLSEGQVKSCNIGGSQIRAMLEASRGNAAINAFEDMNGIEFPALVSGYEDKNGYWKNEIIKIITNKQEEFQTVMGGQDILSDEPVPENKQRNEQTAQPWQQNQGSEQPAQNWGQSAPPPSDDDVPAWLQGK